MNQLEGTAFFTPEAIEHPHQLYALMRHIAPVCAIGDTGAFLAGSHAAVEEALKRHDDFSANLNGMLVCGEDDKPYILNLAAETAASNVIATADEPEHAVHRRLMMPPLKASRIKALEEDLRYFARERVALFKEQGGGNICAILAEPLPAYVVIRLLDLGDGALESVRRWAMMGGDFLAGRLTQQKMMETFTETIALNEYLSNHFDTIAALDGAQRSVSLTATLAGGVEEGLITREQAVGILVVLFGAAGESTAGLLGSCIRLLAEDHDVQAQLRRKPELIPLFIEEALRLEPPFKFHYRYVKRDTELCGTQLKEGGLLLLCWAAANRDPDLFEEADSLSLDRHRPERHYGFGYGIHYCIGAPLARMEIRIALEELLSGCERFTVDPDNPPAHAASVFVRRLQHLNLAL